jgi:hypothetical protein
MAAGKHTQLIRPWHDEVVQQFDTVIVRCWSQDTFFISFRDHQTKRRESAFHATGVILTACRHCPCYHVRRLTKPPWASQQTMRLGDILYQRVSPHRTARSRGLQQILRQVRHMSPLPSNSTVDCECCRMSCASGDMSRLVLSP